MTERDWSKAAVYIFALANMIGLAGLTKHYHGWEVFVYGLVIIFVTWLALMMDHKAKEPTKVPKVILGVMFIVSMLVLTWR